jgi:hypothetical protein
VCRAKLFNMDLKYMMTMTDDRSGLTLRVFCSLFFEPGLR